jgi:hypothetical protein
LYGTKASLFRLTSHGGMFLLIYTHHHHHPRFTYDRKAYLGELSPLRQEWAWGAQLLGALPPLLYGEQKVVRSASNLYRVNTNWYIDSSATYHIIGELERLSVRVYCTSLSPSDSPDLRLCDRWPLSRCTSWCRPSTSCDGRRSTSGFAVFSDSNLACVM